MSKVSTKREPTYREMMLPVWEAVGGLQSNSIMERKVEVCAISVPGGGGKTTIAASDTRIIDIDVTLNKPEVKAMRRRFLKAFRETFGRDPKNKGDFRPLNEAYRYALFQDQHLYHGKYVLTHSFDCLPWWQVKKLGVYFLDNESLNTVAAERKVFDPVWAKFTRISNAYLKDSLKLKDNLEWRDQKGMSHAEIASSINTRINAHYDTSFAVCSKAWLDRKPLSRCLEVSHDVERLFNYMGGIPELGAINISGLSRQFSDVTSIITSFLKIEPERIKMREHFMTKMLNVRTTEWFLLPVEVEYGLVQLTCQMESDMRKESSTLLHHIDPKRADARWADLMWQIGEMQIVQKGGESAIRVTPTMMHNQRRDTVRGWTRNSELPEYDEVAAYADLRADKKQRV